MKRTAASNSTYPKRPALLLQRQLKTESFVLRMNIHTESPTLRVAAKR
ncbi:MAG: hypothetical protein Q8S11_05315 [Daejeonella sp.]|nr:hypothetical protein [Daejeonella sp.]MDP3467730.1 hypothetical protein [Daejeonella sp.]